MIYSVFSGLFLPLSHHLIELAQAFRVLIMLYVNIDETERIYSPVRSPVYF